MIVIHGYLRVSTDQQTIEQQKDAVTNAYPSGTSFQWYEEHESGWQGRRNEYDALMQGIMKGRVKEVVFCNVARLGRNQRQALRFLELCAANQTKIKVLDTPLDFSGPLGMALFALLAAFAQIDSDTKSLNIKRKFALKKKYDPDWRMHGNIKDTVSADIKRKSIEVYRMLASGKSAKYVSEMLGLSEHTIGKLKRLQGKELLTRADYAKKHPGWHNLPIDQRPAV